jgi:hypothetical protein
MGPGNECRDDTCVLKTKKHAVIPGFIPGIHSPPNLLKRGMDPGFRRDDTEI